MVDVNTATIETLTAQVRVLMVGKRQVTLSVYRQLDTVMPEEIEPFGRVRDPKETDWSVAVVGKEAGTGELVRSHIERFSIQSLRRKLEEAERVFGLAEEEIQRRLQETEDANRKLEEWFNQDDEEVPPNEAETLYLQSIIRHKSERLEEARRRGATVAEDVVSARMELDLAEKISQTVKAWDRLPLIVLAGLT